MSGQRALFTSLAMLALTSGCGEDPGSRSSPGERERPAAEREQAQPFPAKPGPLKAGRYRTTKFRPGFTLTVPDGFIPIAPEDEGFFTLAPQYNPTGGPARSLLAFVRIVRVIDPKVDLAGKKNIDHALRPPPKDLIKWFRDAPGEAINERTVRVGGVPGRQIDLRGGKPYPSPYCSRPCVLAFVTSSELPARTPIGGPVGNTTRAIWLPAKGRNFGIALIAPTKDFDKHAAPLQRVLDTLEFTE